MTDAIETGAALQLALEGSVVSARAGQRAMLKRLKQAVYEAFDYHDYGGSSNEEVIDVIYRLIDNELEKL